MSQSQNQRPAAFNLIIEGVGYLNRLRSVEVRKGPSYVACTLNALMGEASSVEYVSIDCRVVGAQALKVMEQLADAVKSKKKVLVGFRASDPKPDFYEYPDAKTGEMLQRSGLKARLLQITFAKVDGQTVTIPLVERRAAAAPADSDSSASSEAGSPNRESVPA